MKDPVKFTMQDPGKFKTYKAEITRTHITVVWLVSRSKRAAIAEANRLAKKWKTQDEVWYFDKSVAKVYDLKSKK